MIAALVLNKQELETEKKKLVQQITKTTDKVKDKITKNVVKVIKSDRNLRLNELKAELKAIELVEATRTANKVKPTERCILCSPEEQKSTEELLLTHLVLWYYS